MASRDSFCIRENRNHDAETYCCYSLRPDRRFHSGAGYAGSQEAFTGMVLRPAPAPLPRPELPGPIADRGKELV